MDGKGEATSTTASALAANADAREPLAVAEAGSFHIGGREVTLAGLAPRAPREPAVPAIKVDPNGGFEVEQTYVQYIRLASPRARHLC